MLEYINYENICFVDDVKDKYLLNDCCKNAENLGEFNGIYNTLNEN